jgi:hypothetical protein
VICGLGVRVSPHGALGAPLPRCTWWRPRYAQKKTGPGLFVKEGGGWEPAAGSRQPAGQGRATSAIGCGYSYAVIPAMGRRPITAGPCTCTWSCDGAAWAPAYELRAEKPRAASAPAAPAPVASRQYGGEAGERVPPVPVPSAGRGQQPPATEPSAQGWARPRGQGPGTGPPPPPLDHTQPTPHQWTPGPPAHPTWWVISRPSAVLMLPPLVPDRVGGRLVGHGYGPRTHDLSTEVFLTSYFRLDPQKGALSDARSVKEMV